MQIISSKILLIFCFLTLQLHAGKLEKGLDALSIHDYFKAKEIFGSLNKKKPNAYACYGLANIYLRNNNPFYSLDSAIKYASISYNIFKQGSKPLLYKQYSINSNSIQRLIDSIAVIRYTALKNDPNIASLENFIRMHYLAATSIRENAIALMNELEYRSVTLTNKISTTQSFIISHPQSSLLPEAHKLMDRQLYEELTSDGSATAYASFIKKFPLSNHVYKAYSELLNLHKKNKDIKGIEEFIINYTNAPQSNEAWLYLFVLRVKKYTKDELELFISKYPQFPYRSSILKDIELDRLFLLPFQKNNAFGFIDTLGKVIISAQYDELTPFTEGLSSVQKGDSVMFINKAGEVFLNRYFNETHAFTNGLAPVRINDTWRLMNRIGDYKPELYEDINPMHEEIYIVKKDGSYGALDAFGNTIIDAKYEKLGDFKYACAYYQLNNAYGFIHKNGYIHPPVFDWISDFGPNGIAIIKKAGVFGMIDQKGKVIVEPKFDQIIKATDDIYIVIVNTSYGFYSSEGCALSEIAFDFQKDKPADHYTNGSTLKLIKNGTQSLIDLNGRTSISFGVYDEINFASCGLICIKKNNKYGYIDRKLATVIPCKYQMAESFKDSVAIVAHKQGYSLINTLGAELLRSDAKINRVAPHLYSTEINDHLSLFDAKGKIIDENIESMEIHGNYLILYLQNDVIKVHRILH